MNSYSDLAHFNCEKEFLMKYSLEVIRELGWEITGISEYCIDARYHCRELSSSGFFRVTVFRGHIIYTTDIEKITFAFTEQKNPGKTFLSKLRETLEACKAETRYSSR